MKFEYSSHHRGQHGLQRPTEPKHFWSLGVLAQSHPLSPHLAIPTPLRSRALFISSKLTYLTLDGNHIFIL